MKVLHIGNFKSGIDTYVRNIVALSNNEFEFVIVGGKDDQSKPFERNGIVVKYYAIDIYRTLNPINDTKAIFQAVKIIKNEKPDLIHCHSAKGGMIGRIAAMLTNRKSIYTAHAFSFLSAESGFKRKIFVLLEKITKFKTFLLGCSESERKLGIKTVGYKTVKSFVWNNAIPEIRLEDISEPDDNVKNEKFIISIGRPSYQKNPLLMVEILRQVHDYHPDVKFYLLGVGFYSPMLNEMKSLVSQYGLDDTIKLLPWLSHSETLGYLKYAKMYLTTSFYEGLPIAVLEALAMKKAVVSSDVIGNNDCVIDGFNGYLLPMDSHLFAEKINYLLDNDDKRNTMGINSFKHFESNFKIENRINELGKIYKEIISL